MSTIEKYIISTPISTLSLTAYGCGYYGSNTYNNSCSTTSKTSSGSATNNTSSTNSNSKTKSATSTIQQAPVVPNKSNGGLSTLGLAAIILAALIVIALIVLFFRKRRKGKDQTPKEGPTITPTNTSSV